MQPLDFDVVSQYVNENISVFHEGRIQSLQNLEVRRMLNKNPYLFRAKNILTASEMVNGFLDAFLSSSEEERFGRFLEGLAIFIAEKTTDGHKSTVPGIDLEFINNGIHSVISIKSGPNWGNASQQDRQEQHFRDSVTRLRQGNRSANIQPVLGICYGKVRTSYVRGYLKVVGQNFWYYVSENQELYTQIIEPIGYKAREHNERYEQGKAETANRMTKAFIDEYCHPSGAIDWDKLVKACCGNYDLDRFFSGT